MREGVKVPTHKSRPSLLRWPSRPAVYHYKDGNKRLDKRESNMLSFGLKGFYLFSKVDFRGGSNRILISFPGVS